MDKKLYLPAATLFVFLLSLTSCGETTSTDAYADWPKRNTEYLDFIASQAAQDLKVDENGKISEALKTGDWRKIQDWRHVGDDKFKSADDYVYIHVNTVGKGNEYALFTDTVYVDYRGALINDALFDASYGTKDIKEKITLFPDKPNSSYGDVYRHVAYVPDTDVTVPRSFTFSNSISGWATAMQKKMRAGDCWTVYIPAKLGYGESGHNSIPGSSVLIFDISLDKVTHPKSKGKK